MTIEMLSEEEIKLEIKTIEKKIIKYENDIKPFTRLEELLKEKIGTNIDVNVVIGQKASKVAMIKSWKKEIQILNRVLEGKKMPQLTDDVPQWKNQTEYVLEMIRKLESQ